MVICFARHIPDKLTAFLFVVYVLLIFMHKGGNCDFNKHWVVGFSSHIYMRGKKLTREDDTNSSKRWYNKSIKKTHDISKKVVTNKWNDNTFEEKP
jgi:hypothetical protein